MFVPCHEFGSLDASLMMGKSALLCWQGMFGACLVVELGDHLETCPIGITVNLNSTSYRMYIIGISDSQI